VAEATYWTDHGGRAWKVPTRRGRLKFKTPAHAALRAFVFRRDGFACVACGAKGVRVPKNYDGRKTVGVVGGWCLVMDHQLSRRNGGAHHPDNLATYCDKCNARKAATVDRMGA
jgi:5-methylcytosine-specific restriction endonuclease McrA